MFDDSAPTYVCDGAAPFTGTYEPQWPLSGLDGERANGTWRLEVVDGWPYYRGTLQGWSIQIW